MCVRVKANTKTTEQKHAYNEGDTPSCSTVRILRMVVKSPEAASDLTCLQSDTRHAWVSASSDTFLMLDMVKWARGNNVKASSYVDAHTHTHNTTHTHTHGLYTHTHRHKWKLGPARLWSCTRGKSSRMMRERKTQTEMRLYRSISRAEFFRLSYSLSERPRITPGVRGAYCLSDMAPTPPPPRTTGGRQHSCPCQCPRHQTARPVPAGVG